MEDRRRKSLINWPYQPKQSPSFLVFCPVLVFLAFLNVLVISSFLCFYTENFATNIKMLQISELHEFCREYQK